MDTNDQYFDCLCRTCMIELVEAASYDGNTKPQQQWQSIFDRIEECGAFRISELLTNAVPQIEVEPRDELPKRICSKCLQELLIVYRFQQMCLQSEQQMRQQVSKKRSDLEIPMIGAAMEGEIETNNAGPYPLKTLQPSTTHQNLEHSSIQESLLETTEQMIKPEAAETSDDDIDKLLEDCRDAGGNLSEFVKNEPIEDDEPSIEYSDDETTISAISEKCERLSIEFEEEQINEASVEKHKCPHCPQSFSKYPNMLQHKAIHKRVKINCDICGKSIRKDHLKPHKQIHSGEKPHKCHLCEKSFTKKAHLRFHIRSHTGEKPYKCKYCERSYFQNSDRMRHMRLHLGDNVYRCELCPLAFPAASELRAHCITHKDEDPETRERNMKALKEAEAKLEQQQFEMKAKKNANMLQHKAIHKEAKINCEICGKSFWNNHLKEHKRIHSREKPHKCHLCEKSFTKKANLRVHIRSHTGEKPYKCKYCERSYFQNSDRMRHMRLHLGDNVHRCKLCPLAFPAASELRTHFTTHETEDLETRERNMKALKEAEAELEIKAKENVEKHKCPHCPQRFSNYENMLQHKAIHKRARINCDICGKSIRKGHLKTHKRIHSGDKPHKCHLCEKSFTEMSKLRVHIRSHTGEKPYKCKYCECSYFQNSDRMRHMCLHLGDNVHRCELCPLAFPAMSELRIHFTTHKNEDPETRERNMKALKEAEAKLDQQQLEMKAKKNANAHSNIDERHYHKESHKRFNPEACDICGKNISKKHMKEHKLTHNDDKPHKCPICEKSFSKKFNLRIHIRHHTGERPYKCKYCDLSFYNTGDHFKHMRIHLGYNVHRCELCPLAFPAALKLRAHFTTHENEDSETRERNMKALKEAEAKLQLKFSKMKIKELRSRGVSTDHLIV